MSCTEPSELELCSSFLESVRPCWLQSLELPTPHSWVSLLLKVKEKTTISYGWPTGSCSVFSASLISSQESFCPWFHSTTFSRWVSWSTCSTPAPKAPFQSTIPSYYPTSSSTKAESKNSKRRSRMVTSRQPKQLARSSETQRPSEQDILAELIDNNSNLLFLSSLTHRLAKVSSWTLHKISLKSSYEELT